MLKTWRQRLLWGSALALAATSYSACAWLWSAPYRPKVAQGAVASSRAVATPEASVLVPAAPSTSVTAAPPPAPIVVQPARTPAFTNTRNFLVIGLDRRPDGTGPALADSLLVVVMDDATRH